MTTTFIRAACATAAVLLLPTLALAASEGGGSTNVLKPDAVNSIVTVIVFVALLAILYAFAWGPILKGLQAREAAQFQAIEDAKKAKEDAAALRSKLDAELAAAAQQAKAIVDEARRDAEALKKTLAEEGRKEADAERERARRDVAIERDAALKDVYTKAVELATLMATKAVRQQVTVDAQSELVNASIAELNATKA
ncbi:F0F1 ATP synthase subunit B [Gemmata sp. JC717]|uniref:F0F1 ATP synthase subunit B n=1 Tax=Gemmata algarum TaxID=2975278 RepID=UPI0021BA5A9C|nr:F0F1 ATP synthase subunit B [Gemmata algarum]MDY3556373.1 F0F1 ATP synthase subunit B [Gemmata algarum]